MSVLDDFRYTIMRRERARLGWKGISKERQATTKDWPVQNCQFDIDLRLRSRCCGQPDLGRKSEVKLRTKTTSPRYVTLLQRGRRKRLVWMRPRSWKKSQKPNQLSRMYTLLISANLACVWWPALIWCLSAWYENPKKPLGEKRERILPVMQIHNP